MNRRHFLTSSLAGSLSLLVSPYLANRALADESAESFDIKTLFESKDPGVLRLAEDVFRQCVLAKIMPPEGTLKRRWLNSGTGEAPFYGQWIWDTMFVVDLLALLPNKAALIRDVFQNYWDFQERWNAKRPEYAHDMIPCMIEPRNTQNWLAMPAYSQIPILGWGLERVYQRNHDKELLKQSLGPLEKFHEWYWRERDVTNVGLVEVGAYSEVVQHGRYETFDNECNLDDLKLTQHPLRKGPGEGKWYGDICLPGITGYLLMSEHSLVRLAKIMGDTAMAKRRNRRIEKSTEAVRKHMWDQQSGTFLAVKRDTLEKVPVATIGSWMPLLADVPTKPMVKRMAETIVTENWQTPLPVPTVDRKDKRWDPNSYWRGDVWPAPNYQVATAFARHGYPQIAAAIADKTVANALQNGISEHYHSVTGKPLGVPYIGMCCTIVTMMLDGLCSQFQLKARRVG